MIVYTHLEQREGSPGGDGGLSGWTQNGLTRHSSVTEMPAQGMITDITTGASCQGSCEWLTLATLANNQHLHVVVLPLRLDLGETTEGRSHIT